MALASIGELNAGAAQGVRGATRSLVARLARVGWFAHLGMAAAERLVDTALKQVTSYFGDSDIRSQAQLSVLNLVDDHTQVVVAHSLGSVVVAYEASFRLSQPLPLLVTIGSPLGLKTIVPTASSLDLQCFPPWSDADLVSAAPDLAQFFDKVPQGSVFESGWRVDNGNQHHDSDRYLTSATVGRPIGETLSGGTGLGSGGSRSTVTACHGLPE